jgi:predicted RNase H-like HicB family nuclease
MSVIVRAQVPGVMSYGETPEQAIVQVKALILQVMGGETALLSEQSLAQDWIRSEEDAAWSHLQPDSVQVDQ